MLLDEISDGDKLTGAIRGGLGDPFRGLVRSGFNILLDGPPPGCAFSHTRLCVGIGPHMRDSLATRYLSFGGGG